MGYGDPSTTVEWNNFAFNWDPGKGHSGDDNIWNSTMTFTLDGGAFVNTINTYTDGDAPAERVENGTFMLDVENHLLNFTDCTLMHTVGWDYKTTTTGWSKNLKILTLTENFLQVDVCTDCGHEHLKWNGKCSGCGAWNTLEETQLTKEANSGSFKAATQIGRASCRERVLRLV